MRFVVRRSGVSPEAERLQEIQSKSYVSAVEEWVWLIEEDLLFEIIASDEGMTVAVTAGGGPERLYHIFFDPMRGFEFSAVSQAADRQTRGPLSQRSKMG